MYLFSDQPLFVSSRSSNLRDKLVHADTYISSPTALVDAQGNFPCHNCTSCTKYVKCKSFTHFCTLNIYKIRQLITCKSTCVIYIICPCLQLYVGKTTRALHTRMIEHTSAIRRPGWYNLQFLITLSLLNHSLSDMKFLGIEEDSIPHRTGGDRDKKLLQREAFWIFELRIFISRGYEWRTRTVLLRLLLSLLLCFRPLQLYLLYL